MIKKILGSSFFLINIFCLNGMQKNEIFPSHPLLTNNGVGRIKSINYDNDSTTLFMFSTEETAYQWNIKNDTLSKIEKKNIQPFEKKSVEDFEEIKSKYFEKYTVSNFYVLNPSKTRFALCLTEKISSDKTLCIFNMQTKTIEKIYKYFDMNIVDFAWQADDILYLVQEKNIDFCSCIKCILTINKLITLNVETRHEEQLYMYMRIAEEKK